MPYDWSAYSGNDNTPSLPVLISERTQQLLLAVIQDIMPRYKWLAETNDSDWDDIDAQIADTITEILEEYIPVSDNTPVGMVMAFASYDTPEKWLGCNGQEVAQATYPELYALIGDDFGSAASGNFKLPYLNVIGRFVRGYLTPPGTGQEIGVTGGAINMQLTIDHLPLHHHVVPAHSHTFLKSTGTASQVLRSVIGNNSGSTDQTTSTQPATDTSEVGQEFPDPVQTLPPYLNMNYVIKALP